MGSEEIEQRIQERSEYLKRAANDLLESGVIPEDKVVLRGRRVDLLTRGYFVLNECYKRWRIEEAHNTEPAKIAALTACAIIAFQPFMPLDRQNTTVFGEAFCNEIFAANVVCAILEIEFDASSRGWKDLWLRIFDILESWPGAVLEPLYVDAGAEIPKDLEAYYADLPDQDKIVINSLISIFELLMGKLVATKLA